MSFLQSVAIGLLVLILPALALVLLWSDASRAGFLGFLELTFRRLLVRFRPRPALAWIEWARRAHRGTLARAFITEAARTGDPEGILEEGFLYWEGSLGAGGKGAAASRFLRAAEAGSAEAMYWVAEDLRWGVSRPADFSAALSWLKRGALAGSGACMASLPQALRAKGLEADLEEATRWEARLQTSGADPRPRRSAILARVEEESADPLVRAMGSAVGATEAWFERPGMQPLLPILGWTAILLITAVVGVLLLLPIFYGGLFALPMLLSLAMLTPLAWRMHKDHRPGVAVRLHLGRAQSGDPAAAFAMGLACLRGQDGVPKDPGEARRWLCAAAEAGHLEAMVEYASLLRWDLGGIKDSAAAEAWLRRAAEAGHAGAQRLLLDSFGSPASQV